MATLNYAKSGVDRKLADRLIQKISLLAQTTLNKKVKASIGGYASLYEVDKKLWIAASTDGVGTKLKLAFELGNHKTIGIDLVAMVVNDLLCVGATPLFFLDYFATGKLNTGTTEQVLEGIVAGCLQAECALVGGETAQLPDFYSPREYDLAGFAVGCVSPKKVLPKNKIHPGDILLGIRSSGFHSNGFSLIRKLLMDQPRHVKLTEELLTPTRIYVKSLKPLIENQLVKGLAHITGSGFLNVPRISDQVSYEITLPPLNERPQIFEWLRSKKQLSLEELTQTFNLGIGMVIVVSSKKCSQVLKLLEASGEKAWEIGQVLKLEKGKSSSVKIKEGNEVVELDY